MFFKPLLRYIVIKFISSIMLQYFCFKDLFNKKFYSNKYRIKNISDGKIIHNSLNYAIFVLYQKNNIPFCIKNALNSFEKLKINCIISINEDIHSEQIEYLKNHCHTIISRYNFGGDFTAYKDAIKITELNECNKLLLLNDSIYYFRRNIDDFFLHFFDANYDVIAATENGTEDNWHCQSYLISVSNKILKSKDFIEFWDKLKPHNSRQYSIQNGEIAFSQKILKHYSDSMKIIYGTNAFAEIASGKYLNISEIKQLLPRKEFKNLEEDLELKEQIEIRFLFLYLIQMDYSPIHICYFLINNLIPTSIMKKDLAYRLTFDIKQIKDNLEKIKIDQDEFNFIIEGLQEKGTIKDLPRIQFYLKIYGLN